MKFTIVAPFFLTCWLASTHPSAAQSAAPKSDAARMENESVVFCSDLDPRRARLLFDPTKVESVRSANGATTYEEGKDYRLLDHGRMELTPNSRIPVLKYYGDKADKKSQLYGFKDSKGRAFYSPGDNQKHNDYDVVVTYTHANGLLEQLMNGAWEAGMTTALKKLEFKQPLKVAFFGDSITFGAQASSLGAGCPPNAPAYPQQVINALKSLYGYSDIQFVNPSVGGKNSEWGLQEIKQVTGASPDLVVLAFGMNDASGRMKTEKYRANIEGMIKVLRGQNPNVSILLVAEFSPNPEWPAANYPLRAQNRESLYSLHKAYENTAFVDVGMVSRRMAERKKFQDFSGNNINHPNDFLHRIYADLIMKTLRGEKDHP